MRKTTLKSLTREEFMAIIVASKTLGVTQVNDDVLIIRIFA